MVEMLVSELMVEEVVTVKKDESVQRVAGLMTERKIGSIVIVENKEPIGIVTERDLVTRILALSRDPGDITIQEIMSKPVISISKDKSISDAVHLMKERDIRRLMVTEDDKLVGIISTKDITGYLSSLVVLRWL
jgi:CBS domain-containing protein